MSFRLVQIEVNQIEVKTPRSLTRVIAKDLLFKFDGKSVKLKPTNGSKDNVSHAAPGGPSPPGAALGQDEFCGFWQNERMESGD
jgi:hypothetical protein